MTKLIVTLLLALSACANLDPATLIKRDRVLGAKVTVDTDPERAWPAAGEAATVTWVTASPGAPPTFSWILAACPAATSSSIPMCAGPVFAASSTSGAVPTLPLVIPADIAASAVVVTGVICASGSPAVDGAAATCDDGSQADVVSQHIFIATGDATNHNPNLAGAPLTAGGMEWRAATTGCDGDLPVVTAGSGRTLLGVTFDASDREPFAVGGELRASREDLQLSAFATAGEILQQHTYVEADDEREESPVALEWESPGADEVPSEGLRVRFHFVVRDMRGGVDSTVRELCVR